MKKKWILIFSVFILVGGGLGLFMFNQNREKSKEIEAKNIETMLIKALKNNFSDIKEVKFIPKYSGGYDKMTGYWGFAVEITTKYGTASPGTISYNTKNPNETGSMGPLAPTFDEIVKEGRTINTVTVIYSDKSKGDV